jgi:hypothetical protein
MTISKTLSRRLERLEEQIAPLEEPRVWQIVYVDSDGNRTDGERIEWSRRPDGALRPAIPAFRKPYR